MKVLKTWLLRPYPGKLDKKQIIFKYRLSRARRIIENIFGILSLHWRTFYTTIRANVETVEKYVLACLCLHSYLQLTGKAFYCPTGFVDSFDDTEYLKQGDWSLLMKDYYP